MMAARDSLDCAHPITSSVKKFLWKWTDCFGSRESYVHGSYSRLYKASFNYAWTWAAFKGCEQGSLYRVSIWLYSSDHDEHWELTTKYIDSITVSVFTVEYSCIVVMCKYRKQKKMKPSTWHWKPNQIEPKLKNPNRHSRQPYTLETASLTLLPGGTLFWYEEKLTCGRMEWVVSHCETERYKHWPGELMSVADSCILAFVLSGCKHDTLSTSIGIKFIAVSVHIKQTKQINQVCIIINQPQFSLS